MKIYLRVGKMAQRVKELATKLDDWEFDAQDPRGGRRLPEVVL